MKPKVNWPTVDAHGGVERICQSSHRSEIAGSKRFQSLQHCRLCSAPLLPLKVTACVVFLATRLANGATIPYTNWAITLGTNLGSYTADVAADGAGNSYVTSLINGAEYRAKVSPTGHLLWHASGSAAQFYTGLVADGSGNSYVLEHGGSVQKFNSAGNQVWLTSMPNAVANSPSIAVDSGGDVFAAGYVQSNPPGRAEVVKFDALGNLLWTKTPPTAAPESQPVSVGVDASGDVVVAGQNLNSQQAYTGGFVAKYDPLGNLLWSQQFSSIVKGLGVDPAGDVYLDFFGPSGTLQKYSSSNQLLWTTLADSSSSNMPIAIDPNGREFVLSNSGVVGYDSLGNQILQFQVPFSAMNLAYGAGHIYVSNYEQGVPTNGYTGFLTDFVVPEPSGAALGLIGFLFAALCWAGSRRDAARCVKAATLS